MNQVQFQVKRAHWRLWDFEAKLLAPFGTTPARLDMLQCIAKNGAPTQATLGWHLGLTPSTISKMLTRLEALGLVHRDVNPFDFRGRIARLTDAARALLARVRRVLLKSGVARLAQVRCLVDDRRSPSRVLSLFEQTRRVQWALEDRANFVPEVLPSTEAADIEGLEGDERKLYSHAVGYCRSRFYHLPTMYLLDMEELVSSARAPGTRGS